MKKLILLCITVCMLVSLTACITIEFEEPSGSPSTSGATVEVTDPTELAAEPTDQVLADTSAVKVTFEEVFEAPGVGGVFYLRMNIENKTDREVWVYLDSASVNGEMTTVMSGVPTIISAGNSSKNPFIFSFANLSAAQLSEVQTISFKIVIRDNASSEIIETTDTITITL